jgi:hypothetical protein
MVYLIVCEENSTCEIGYSYDNAQGRLMQLRNASPYDIQLKYWIDGDYAEEKRLHHHFSKYRLKREWFTLNDEILSYFAERAVTWDNEDHKRKSQHISWDSYVSVPVMMKHRMRMLYKPEELSVMLVLGEKIHNMSEESAKSVLEYISLITKPFGHTYPELKQMISFLLSCQDRQYELMKERNELLDFIDSKEIHECADEHWIDLIEHAKNN